MKAGWEVKTLKEVCEKITDGTHQTPTYYDEGIIFLSSRNVTSGRIDWNNIKYIDTKQHMELHKRLAPRVNDILLAKNGTTGVAAIVDKDVVFDIYVSLALLRPLEQILPTFLLYFINSPIAKEQFNKRLKGVGVPNLHLQEIREVKISVPPLPEQQRIVAILDAAFASIATAKANTEQNLKNARALFDSYLHEVFENPKDTWQQKKWGDLCDFVRGPFGGSLKKNIFKEDGYVVYEQKHAIHDHFNQLRYFIDEDKFNEMIRFEVKPGDIIMSCSGSLGRVAIVPEGIKRGIINQALLKLTPKKNVYVHFIKHWLRSSVFQKIIFEFSGGAAIANVPSAKILKDILIPLPPIDEQMLIVDRIENMQKETQRLETLYQRKLTALEELKKALLHQAFSGML
jgi:type I restriction enzyme S subunit